MRSSHRIVDLFCCCHTKQNVFKHEKGHFAERKSYKHASQQLVEGQSNKISMFYTLCTSKQLFELYLQNYIITLRISSHYRNSILCTFLCTLLCILISTDLFLVLYIVCGILLYTVLYMYIRLFTYESDSYLLCSDSD